MKKSIPTILYYICMSYLQKSSVVRVQTCLKKQRIANKEPCVFYFHEILFDH